MVASLGVLLSLGFFLWMLRELTSRHGSLWPRPIKFLQENGNILSMHFLLHEEKKLHITTLLNRWMMRRRNDEMYWPANYKDVSPDSPDLFHCCFIKTIIEIMLQYTGISNFYIGVSLALVIHLPRPSQSNQRSVFQNSMVNGKAAKKEAKDKGK